MKCHGCRGCMRMVRIDKDSGVVLAYFCGLCHKAYYVHGGDEILSSQDIYEEIKEKYFKLYRNLV